MHIIVCMGGSSKNKIFYSRRRLRLSQRWKFGKNKKIKKKKPQTYENRKKTARKLHAQKEKEKKIEEESSRYRYIISRDDRPRVRRGYSIFVVPRLRSRSNTRDTRSRRPFLQQVLSCALELFIVAQRASMRDAAIIVIKCGLRHSEGRNLLTRAGDRW